MKAFLILIIIISPLIIRAQSRDSGLWVKVRAEMEDGSRIVDRVNSADGFFKYRFNGKGTVKLSSDVLFDQMKWTYYFNGAFLTVGRINYKVDKLTADSLVITEVNVNVDSSKLRRYYYLKQDNISATDKPVYNSDLKDSVYHYSRYLFPECKGEITAIMDQLKEFKFYDNGDLKIGFIINKAGKLVNLNIIENNKLGNGFTKAVVKAFESSTITWFPATLNRLAVNVYLELSIRFTNDIGSRSYSLTYPLFKTPTIKGLTLDEMGDVDRYYQKGLKETKNHNYQKGIEALTKCIATDPIFFDAYYLRAYLYLQIGDVPGAERDWRYLADLGQVRATRFLKTLK